MDRLTRLLEGASEERRELIQKTVDLWGKTVEISKRPQHFDSYEVDSNEFSMEWDSLVERIKASLLA